MRREEYEAGIKRGLELGRKMEDAERKHAIEVLSRTLLAYTDLTGQTIPFEYGKLVGLIKSGSEAIRSRKVKRILKALRRYWGSSFDIGDAYDNS